MNCRLGAGLLAALAGLGLGAQEAQAPVDLNAIPWVWGSSCASQVPRRAAKAANGEHVVLAQGTLNLLKEGPDGRLHLDRQVRFPNPKGEARYQAREFWVNRGPEILLRDERLGRWFSKYRVPDRFLDFEVLFDSRVLVVGTTHQKWLSKGHFLEVFDGADSTPTLTVPWPKDFKEPKGFYPLQYWTSLTTLPYEELVLVYGNLSGRLWLFDASKDSLEELGLPWSSAAHNDPARDRAAIEGRVPRCLQWIPTLGHTVVALYDAQSVLSEQELRASADEAWHPAPKPPRWKALKLDLLTHETSELDVPAKVELPMACPDGFHLEPLGTFLERETAELRAREAKSKPQKPGTSK